MSKEKDQPLGPAWSDIRKVSDVARATIVIVMERNIDKGTTWRKQTVENHKDHARKHLLHIFSGGTKVDLENALTRIAMALILMEGKEDES